jgi:hypothetical protein
MNDAIAIALEGGAHWMRRFVDAPAARIARKHRIRRERPRFQFFKILSRAQHSDE